MGRRRGSLRKVAAAAFLPVFLAARVRLTFSPGGRFTIQYFDQGLLASVEPGTSLRSLLAAAINCDPMRISKKFVGEQRIGKRVFAQ